MDLKPAAIGLPAEQVIEELERRLGPRAETRRGRASWSAHFAATEDHLLASSLREVVIEPLLAEAKRACLAIERRRRDSGTSRGGPFGPAPVAMAGCIRTA